MADLMADPLEYIKDLQVSLKVRDSVEFRRLVQTKQALQPGIFWDFATEICKHLTNAIYEEAAVFFETCEEGLKYLIENGNPKELLIIILEHIDDDRDDLKYRTLMEATQAILLKIPTRRVKSLDIALETLFGHIASLEQPDECGLEGEEKKLLEGDPKVARIGEVVKLFLQFLRPFVWEVSVNNPNNAREKNGHQVRELTRCILKLLSHPLLYVDLSHTDDTGQVTKTLCRTDAEITVQYLSQLHTNFHKLIMSTLDSNAHIERENWMKQERKRTRIEDNIDKQDGILDDVDMDLELEEPVPEDSLACFSYLVHGEQIGRRNWPCVYSHTYTLCHCLPFIKRLLRKRESLVIYKGIFLAEAILDNIPRKTLLADLLELDETTDFVLVLIDIMLHCSVTELRQLAVKLLPYFINKFTLQGRYKLMEFVLHKTSHSGIASLVVKMIKDQLAAVLKSKDSGKPFVGASLEKLVSFALKLPEGATSDLLDQSDRIMAGLNLVRFLVLSDSPTVNKTGVWSRLEIIEGEFLNPLKTGINMSRAHYDMELKNIKSGRKTSDEIEMNVNVNGVNSLEMSEQEKVQVLQNAVVTFDLMESVHGRVSEIISAQKNAQKTDNSASVSV
ncbi:glomulin-like isoform X2 [Liolophura sinensis]